MGRQTYTGRLAEYQAAAGPRRCERASTGVEEFSAPSLGVINQGEKPNPYGLGRESRRDNGRGLQVLDSDWILAWRLQEAYKLSDSDTAQLWEEMQRQGRLHLHSVWAETFTNAFHTPALALRAQQTAHRGSARLSIQFTAGTDLNMAAMCRF